MPFGFFLLIHSYNILLVDDDDNKTILPNLHDESDGDMATEVHTIIRSVTKLRDDREIHHHHPIPPLLMILITTTPYQIWYTQSNVGVVGIHRRERMEKEPCQNVAWLVRY